MQTSGTARRLFLSFAVLLSTFAAASAVALLHLRGVRGGLAEMRDRVEGVRLALELASAVRDQYAHQAHTIILGNDTHLRFYDEAERRVGELTAKVRDHVASPEERGWVDDIERASAQLDQVFRSQIVPSVLRHDRTGVQEEHARAQLLVSLIQDRADQLVRHFEDSITSYQAQVSALQDATFRWTLLFLAVVPLLALAVGAYVLRSVAGPLARLREGAARLAEGDLDTRIRIDADDEFGALARQWNAMTEALKEHQRRLVQQEKLAGIGRLAAGLAHEINNPLAVILGYARLLGKRSDGAAREDLQVIEDETLRAKGIVDGLLDLSRPLEVNLEPVDLRALCDEVVARLSGTPVLQGVQVAVAGRGSAAGDAPKLRQVVVNLVKNAAEAAGPGGRVELEVTEDGERVSLGVSDTGPGLSQEVRARLFEPFFSGKDGGTGLGLAVSKGIVEAHGGAIDAESLSRGGARFSVRLPRRLPGVG
ncbi:MAG TPA: ATP-binding protein [Anaeromyxobacter sp.]|nr:ATP-binding protein [Anaeromyxobacter sp.]